MNRTLPSRYRTGRRGALFVVLVSVVLSVLVSPALAGATDASSADELESFGLASPLVDTSSPGGTLADGRTVPKVNVLLPAGYDSNRSYPVWYLLHGANGGSDSWVHNIAALTKGFPGIIVMPDGGTYGMYVDWYNGGERGGPAWASYDLTVLRSTIESWYHILPGRRWHAIGGISMGGQGALRLSAMLPGYFGTVTTFSAAIPDMQSLPAQVVIPLTPLTGAAQGTTYTAMFGPAQGAYAEGNNPQALAVNEGHTRMYLTSGNGINCASDPIASSFLADLVTETVLHAQQAPYARAVSAAGADVTTATTCGVHTFGVWDRAIVAAQKWGVFGPVDDHPTSWTYRTVATSGEMWNLDFRFATPPTKVATFARDGVRLTGSGTGHVTVSAPGGCELELDLPFAQTLPAACR